MLILAISILPEIYCHLPRRAQTGFIWQGRRNSLRLLLPKLAQKSIRNLACKRGKNGGILSLGEENQGLTSQFLLTSPDTASLYIL